MALLGVKWSPIARAALPLVDVVEVDGWALDQPAFRLPPGPRLIHNLDLDFTLTQPGVIDDAWLARCERAVERVGAPWFSLHLGFSAERVQFVDHLMPRAPVLDRATCFARVVEPLQRIQAGLSVPLLVENMDYCPEGAYEHVCDPAFIAEVVDAVGCGLLLDLAHLQVSADWLGLDPVAYLDRLPLDRVVEVHVSSPRPLGERLDDCHHHLLPRDYALLRALLDRCDPAVVLLEYRRDQSLLLEQLIGLRAMLLGAVPTVARGAAIA